MKRQDQILAQMTMSLIFCKYRQNSEWKVVFMIYASQNRSTEFSNRKLLIVCASVLEIICPGPSLDQNDLPHTIKIMVYIHIMFGYLFDNSIKMVYWLFGHNLRGLRKLKVSCYFQSGWKISQERTEILDTFSRYCMDIGGKIFLWLFT